MWKNSKICFYYLFDIQLNSSVYFFVKLCVIICYLWNLFGLKAKYSCNTLHSLGMFKVLIWGEWGGRRWGKGVGERRNCVVGDLVLGDSGWATYLEWPWMSHLYSFWASVSSPMKWNIRLLIYGFWYLCIIICLCFGWSLDWLPWGQSSFLLPMIPVLG